MLDEVFLLSQIAKVSSIHRYFKERKQFTGSVVALNKKQRDNLEIGDMHFCNWLKREIRNVTQKAACCRVHQHSAPLVFAKLQFLTTNLSVLYCLAYIADDNSSIYVVETSVFCDLL